MIDYHVGDTRAVVATLPDASVSLVASSPPFIALRSYLPADHPAKHAEIGSEPDPATFLDTLLALTAEWGRVLAPWGSIAIELGDTYAGSGGAGGDYALGGLREGQEKFDGSSYVARQDTKTHNVQDVRATGGGIANLHGKIQPGGTGWPRAKSLALIPQLYATSLAYGRNLLTGQPSPAGQWLVRNVIVWHRPNPAVGALGDKVRPSTSYITVATRSPRRWFDLDAVRQPVQHPNQNATRNGKWTDGDNDATRPALGNYHGSMSAGAPPLDCWFDHHDTWTITTQPSSLAHYAMWPARLAERLILMMCPAEVCAACGTPRRRLTRTDRVVARTVDHHRGEVSAAPVHGGPFASRGESTVTTLGWSDCGCKVDCPTCDGKGRQVHLDGYDTRCRDCTDGKVSDYHPGVVLDPFAGTGTTLAVADLHGRDAIGIDLDERNRDLYPRRRDECARALFDVRPQMDGQMGLFG